MCVCQGGLQEREVMERVCVCVCWLEMGGLVGVQGVHEASLPYQRHARLSVLMVITLPTIGAHCSDHNNKKKKNSKNGWRDEEEGY